MPGLGTGFNEKIKTRLFSFLEACYEGLQEQVALGRLDAKTGINREFTEIKQYLGLIRKQAGNNPEIVEKLIIFLEACYKCMYENVEKTNDLNIAIESKFRELERYIDAIEKKQKATYGSIWDQKIEAKS